MSQNEVIVRHTGSPPVHVYWTAELIANLATLWVAGNSTTITAKALGMSRSSVVGKVNSLRSDPTPGRNVRVQCL